jgi:hypothetical protein
MSIAVMTAVWTGSRHSGSELLMLLALADFSDDAGNSYPAVATLAKKCRMQPRNANYVLKALQAGGELQMRPNEGPNGTNRYRIVLKALQPVAGVQARAGVQRSAGLQPSAPTPAMECAKPLQRSADKPSLNRQEPERVRATRTSPTERGSRLPADWTPSAADVAYCRERRPDLDPPTVAEAFRDHWNAASGQSASKRDWQAAWRTWVRKERGGHIPARRAHLPGDDELFTGGRA